MAKHIEKKVKMVEKLKDAKALKSSDHYKK